MAYGDYCGLCNAVDWPTLVTDTAAAVERFVLSFDEDVPLTEFDAAEKNLHKTLRILKLRKPIREAMINELLEYADAGATGQFNPLTLRSKYHRLHSAQNAQPLTRAYGSFEGNSR